MKKARSKGLPLLALGICSKADALTLAPTCATFQPSSSCVCTPSSAPATLTLSLRVVSWLDLSHVSSLHACWLTTGLFLTLITISGKDPDPDSTSLPLHWLRSLLSCPHLTCYCTLLPLPSWPGQPSLLWARLQRSSGSSGGD